MRRIGLRKGRNGTRLFFATDVHGSETCFRKWLNAAAAYNVDAVVLGGDITGKALAPIIQRRPGQWEGVLNERVIAVNGDAELSDLRRRIRKTGFYDVTVSEEEEQALAQDAQAVENRIAREMAARLRDWVTLADERLADRGVMATWMLGNDDTPDLADILRGSRRVVYAEDGVLELPGGFEMISLGMSNPTPFHTPREVSEEELAARLEDLAGRLESPATAVFNLHCPPRDTLLDQAPRLGGDLRPTAAAGGVEMTAIGSRAVRAIIEQYQPLVGLHGHVHESPGVQSLGRTQCINPGSEYVDGIVRGALVTLYHDHPPQWQMVQG
jgi:uncharacterized protein